jgi:hypothetical protein
VSEIAAQPADELPRRGHWPTAVAIGVALLPLLIGWSIGLAVDRKETLGPFTATQVAWGVVLLALAYPTIAALAARQASAPAVVQVVAAVAPALVYAGRLLMEVLPPDRAGERHEGVLVLTALLPAIFAAGTFAAISMITGAADRSRLSRLPVILLGTFFFAVSFVVPFLLMAFQTTY